MTFEERRAAARIDALLLAQSLWSDDELATNILMRYCDPLAVACELAAWLRTAVTKALECGAGPEFGDLHEFDVLARWLQDVQQEKTS
ncbi:hypothetical protein [Mycobacterium avium]|uniref:hypothetical protein n=1 Tax=Mycobacterium avium TaxID=1764 RepID=UPI001CC5265B|nr:hypothetical protein [Mycobacterium avium]MBZ4620989.1 hypothetical protein [Mycobacterium avium subsp. hominissuis]